MRRLPLAVALPLLAALALPASASARPAPFAGEVRTAETTFQLGGRDGRTWLVGLTVDEVHPAYGAVARSLTVRLRPCTVDKQRHARCTAGATYTLPVDDAGIGDDLATARVRARVFGTVLDVAWSVTDTATVIHSEFDEQGAEARRAGDGGTGPVTGVVLGPRCRTNGTVAGSYVVSTEGPPTRAGGAPPASLPAPLMPTRGWRPHCV